MRFPWFDGEYNETLATQTVFSHTASTVTKLRFGVSSKPEERTLSTLTETTFDEGRVTRVQTITSLDDLN